jgi:hypothetical protein
VPGTGLDRERHCANWAEGCGSRAFGRHFGLSDVTDWSDHWIGAFFPLNHSWPQMFRQVPRGMPFPGAETALPCVRGVGQAFSPSLAPAALENEVARDGIEPPPPAFSGPLIDKAKWLRISASDTHSTG